MNASLSSRLRASGTAAFVFTFATLLAPCAAQVTDWITGIEADRLLVTDSGDAVWKANCESAASSRTRITSALLNGTLQNAVLNLPGCPLGSQARGGIATSGSSVFWVDSNGKVKRNTGIILATSPDAARISPYGEMAASPGYVFWTDEEGEFYDGGRLWRAARAGGGSPELIADYTVNNRGGFRAVAAVSDTRVITLLTNGNLVNHTLAPGLPPFGIPFWLSANIATSVSAMNVRGGRIHWVSYSGTTSTFYSAPLTDTSARTNLGTQTTTAGQLIYQLATGDGRIFYQVMSGASGDLRRRSATAAGTAETVAASLPYAVKELRANDQWVCWIKNDTIISRLPVGTAAVTRNLTAERPTDAPAGAPFLEVIQAVQNPLNQCPLVADKVTHVRAYARIAASSAGETSLMPSPPIVLHGTRGGVALPGSPLTPSPFPSPPPPLGTAAGTRTAGATGTTATSGYWFRLPPAWTAEGTISLTSEVNPGRTMAETSYADNFSPAVPAAFTQKVPIGLKLIPTVTHFGTISRYQPAYQEFFDQLEMLLPTSDLRFEFCRDLLDEEQGFWDHSPFEFRPDDDDWSKVLWGLGWKKVFGSGGRLAEPGGYDHYVAMLPAAANQGVRYSGVAWPGDEVSITVSQSLFFVNANRSELGVRMDATTEAQEVAHNYGLRHVDCGGPDAVNILNPYPYPSDVLSTPAAGYQGFNPLSNRLIGWSSAKDYMSYCSPKWSSDHAWRRMYSRVSSGFGPRGVAGSPPWLMGGLIDTAGHTAGMRAAFRLGAAEAVRAAANMPAEDARYLLNAYQGGSLKRTFMVHSSDPLGDEGHTAGETIAWMAAPGDLSDIDRLVLVEKSNQNTPLGEIKGGGLPPVVNVIAPAAGSVISTPSFTIKWTSSDDGGRDLNHMVRFSPDNGTTWHLLASDHGPSELSVTTASVPGGTKCVVEVIASDGILSTAARSGNFSIGNKAPEITLFFENARGKICAPLAMAAVDCGESLTLHAEVSDLEDGWLPDSTITWTLTGPVNRTGSGRLYRPDALIPGSYTVTAQVTDGSGLSAFANSRLIVRPCYVENAATDPVTDGLAADAAYTADAQALPIRYSTGQLAEVRMVHRAGKLHIAASGLVPGTHAGHRFAIAFDMDRSGSAPETGDLLVEVYDHGSAVVSGANTVDWVPESDPVDILTGVSGDASRWAVEVAVPDARFTAWDGRTVRCWMGVLDRTASGDHSLWPPGVNTRAAGTWVDLVLGPDPDDSTDADRDRLPDAWEIRTFGNTTRTAATDSDGDGQNDGTEFVSGTDPRSAASRFLATPGTADRSVSWNSSAGRSYTIWRSTGLNFWETAATGLESAGASTTWTDPAPPAGKAFYRVEAHYCR